MKKIIIIFLFLFLILLSADAVAHEEENPYSRKGAYFGFGMGYIAKDFDLDEAEN